MKLSKQNRLLSFIEKGKYRVDTDVGCLYSYRANKDAWTQLKGSVDRFGFRQVTLYPGKEGMFVLNVYEHVAVWIAGHGIIPPGGKVLHKDGDTSNNKLWNLTLVIEKPKKWVYKNPGQLDAIQADEIYKLYCSGVTNCSRIAEALLICRQKVRRAILKFKNNEGFRFEQQFSAQSFVARELLRTQESNVA